VKQNPKLFAIVTAQQFPLDRKTQNDPLPPHVLPGLVSAHQGGPTVSNLTKECLDDLLWEVLKPFMAFANKHQAFAIALWILHTFKFSDFDQSPILAVTSPEKRCGKSRLLELLALVVSRPWLVMSNATEAALFRKIQSEQPTVLLDEIDALFKGNADRSEPIRALLNAGNREGVSVSRVVGKGAEMGVREFKIFCPKGIAAIGNLPDTIADRAIPIRLQRKLPHETVLKLRRKQRAEIKKRFGARLAAWSKQVDFRGVEPEVPESLSDREADNWESLIAIADHAGGEWPEMAREAALALHTVDPRESDKVRVLVDLARVALPRLTDRETVLTRELVEWLVSEEESRWRSLRNGKPLGAQYLGSLLGEFELKSKAIRLTSEQKERYGTGALKGLEVAALRDVIARYVPAQNERS